MYFKIAWGNVKKSVRDFGIYFLTLFFGVCIFYAFNSIHDQAGVLTLTQDARDMLVLLSRLLNGVSVFIAVVLAFLMVYANQFLIRRRKREFGMYLTLGMELRKVSGIVVLETFMVGLLALAAGLVAGVLLSQFMLWVTAQLFEATIQGFTFLFSGEACLATIACFILMFLVTNVINVGSLAHFKLIDLINANKKSETARVRSLPLCVVLFVVSLVLIGLAYKTLIDNGLKYFDNQFMLATGLVSIGTLLFFFSLSGFLLRAAQLNRGLYYHGLNMFSLRQLNSRINSAWLSISIVCAALFLAITSTSGGFAISNSFNEVLKSAAPFSATFTTYTAERADDERLGRGISDNDKPAIEAMRADNADMAQGLKKRVPLWDASVEKTVQINRLYDPAVTFATLYQPLMGKFNMSKDELDMQGGENPIGIMKLSEVNAARALMGEAALTLASDEAYVVPEYSGIVERVSELVQATPELSIAGTKVKLKAYNHAVLYQNGQGMGQYNFSLVVPDSFVNTHKDALYASYSILNLQYKPGINEEEFYNQCIAASPQSWQNNQVERREVAGEMVSSAAWPFYTAMTASAIKAQSQGTTALISYLAIYIGFVLLMASAAILAIQQLSSVADNVMRYKVLRDLGAEPAQICHALLFQVGVYFLFPLVVALVHSSVALHVIKTQFERYMPGPFVPLVLAAMAVLLVLYFAYFFMTYRGSKRMVLEADTKSRE